MSEQHTAGSIRYDYEPGYCGELIARDGMTVAAFVNEPSEADARRLVACWNACDGLPTESLECGKPPADQIVDALNQRHELMAQRDELLEALEFFLKWGRCQRAEDKARAAIAKTEEAIT